jgi:hypothetical protein
MSERVGQKVRLILITGHHYSGKILEEDLYFLTILDKFSKKVSIQKQQIQVLEVLG